MKNQRKCSSCNTPKLKNKRSCFNISCSESKPYKKQKEKDEKRKKKEKENKLRPPKAGTNVKNRSASTRNGMIISVSKSHAPEITEYDVDNRNNLLKIDPLKCFWCKVGDKKDNDHAHPCCNTTNHEYSYTNALNIVPSCKSCNSKKGGTRLEDWINNLEWPEKDKEVYKKWLYENKKKLLFNDEDIKYIERQFITINKIHLILDYCAKYKLEVSDYISVDIPEDL